MASLDLHLSRSFLATVDVLSLPLWHCPPPRHFIIDHRPLSFCSSSTPIYRFPHHSSCSPIFLLFCFLDCHFSLKMEPLRKICITSIPSCPHITPRIILRDHSGIAQRYDFNSLRGTVSLSNRPFHFFHSHNFDHRWTDFASLALSHQVGPNLPNHGGGNLTPRHIRGFTHASLFGIRR